MIPTWLHNLRIDIENDPDWIFSLLLSLLGIVLSLDVLIL